MKPIIELIKGDITKINADAIFKFTNSSLLGKIGVDGVIYWAVGKADLDQRIKIWVRQKKCKTHEVFATSEKGFAARYVIHKLVDSIWNNEKMSQNYWWIIIKSF